jgi:hypothetical protein
MKTTIRIEALAALLLAAAPAFAQAPPSDTLKTVLAKGAVFSVDGVNYEFVAKTDGTYTDKAGALKGKYRVDGKSLCVTPSMSPGEACMVFPDGKASGATFEVEGGRGPATVTIS